MPAISSIRLLNLHVIVNRVLKPAAEVGRATIQSVAIVWNGMGGVTIGASSP